MMGGSRIQIQEPMREPGRLIGGHCPRSGGGSAECVKQTVNLTSKGGVGVRTESVRRKHEEGDSCYTFQSLTKAVSLGDSSVPID